MQKKLSWVEKVTEFLVTSHILLLVGAFAFLAFGCAILFTPEATEAEGFTADEIQQSLAGRDTAQTVIAILAAICAIPGIAGYMIVARRVRAHEKERERLHALAYPSVMED